MLKICLCSDNHGDMDSINKILSDNPACDYYFHCGDSLVPPEELSPFASVEGNNDWAYDYGRQIKKTCLFYGGGVLWEVNHYRERLKLAECDIAVCGHTHRPSIDNFGKIIVMNPGSPTFPRGTLGPTIGRVIIEDGTILSAEIVQLKPNH